MTLVLTFAANAAERVTVDRVDNAAATSGFVFSRVPRPVVDDAAQGGTWEIVDGTADRFSGGVGTLSDGRLPLEEDAPGENFFFEAGTDGGRLRLDLDGVVGIRQIRTYSWHPAERGPQVYRVYGSDGASPAFEAAPKRGTDPASCGWTDLAEVDTRFGGETGGQYGVTVGAAESGPLGRFRYLLFDCRRTSADSAFSNTFYSEIDVIRMDAPDPKPVEVTATEGAVDEVEAGDGRFKILIDTTGTPDLSGWVRRDLTPVVREWYPKLVEMLPSEGFEAPRTVRIVFRPEMQGVAATQGTRISCAARWFRRNLDGEAKGAIVHELVHAVQQYGQARRREGGGNRTRNPGWLVEGVADYLRWFKYEPESRGAEVRDPARARYDASYRVTANFLNWVVARHGDGVIRSLNAAMREGRYSEELWKTLTGTSVQELGEGWKASIGAI